MNIPHVQYIGGDFITCPDTTAIERENTIS